MATSHEVMIVFMSAISQTLDGKPAQAATSDLKSMCALNGRINPRGLLVISDKL
jgi:hypothetical protein